MSPDSKGGQSLSLAHPSHPAHPEQPLSLPATALALPMYTPRSTSSTPATAVSAITPRSARGALSARSDRGDARSARSPFGARGSSGKTSAYSTPSSPSPSRVKSQKREALLLMSASMSSGVAELRAKEEFELQRGPSRQRYGERARKSEANLRVPSSASEILANAVKQTRAPHTEFSEIVKASGRFICPIPACGCSFARKEMAFEHLSLHEQKKQLGTTVPIVDSKMKYYWPEGASWREGQQFSDGPPVAKIPCPAAGCRLCFPTQEALKTHSRLFHRSALDSPSSLSAGWFKLGGEQYAVPPKEPAVPLPLKWCPRHVLSSGRCPTCLELEALTGLPLAPFMFFGSVEIDFAAKKTLDIEIEKVDEVVVEEKTYLPRESRSNSFSLRRRGAVAQRPEPKLTFSTESVRAATHGVYVLDDHSDELFQASVVAAFLDRRKSCWVAVQALLSYKGARALGIPLPADFNKQFELTEMPTTTASSSASMRVVPISAVQGYFSLRAGKAPSPSASPSPLRCSHCHRCPPSLLSFCLPLLFK